MTHQPNDAARPTGPVLVAHRGDQTRWPENTLPAVTAALTAGAAAIEIDVQLSADRVPVLMHDERLLRTCGVDAPVSAKTAEELAALGAQHGSGRVPVPTLAAVIAAVQDTTVEVFVEIKRAAVERFGVDAVVDRVAADLAPLGRRAVVIAFDARVVERVRAAHHGPAGWILPAFEPSVRTEAAALAPDVLACNVTRIPSDASLRDGPWRWMVYTVNSADDALAWGARGATLVETDHVSTLLGDPRLGGKVARDG